MPVSCEIVPASPRHIRPLAKRLRAGACVALMDRGFDPRRALHDAFMGSHYCRAALVDGRVAAMWGLEGPLLGGAAKIWLALSEEVGHLPVMIVREARRELAEIAAVYGGIEAAVLPEDQAAVRFASFLGFREHGERIPTGDGYVISLKYGGAI